MPIWVVRHGCAGHKDEWDGDDDERPLDPAGERQAEAIADFLAPHRPRRLLASPARRCLGTLGPLADRLGLPLEAVDDLRPDRPAAVLLELLEHAAREGDVLCTHGELLRPTWRALHERGVVQDAADDTAMAKGVIWELTGPPLALAVHVPLALADCPHHR